MRAGLAAARFDGQVRLVLVDKLTVGTHTTGSAVTRRSRAHGATAPLRELVAGGGLASDDQQAGQRRGVDRPSSPPHTMRACPHFRRNTWCSCFGR